MLCLHLPAFAVYTRFVSIFFPSVLLFLLCLGQFVFYNCQSA